MVEAIGSLMNEEMTQIGGYKTSNDGKIQQRRSFRPSEKSMLSPTGGSASDCQVADILNIIFEGREYHEKVRYRSRHQIDAAIKTEKYCQECLGLDQCITPITGWQTFFDPEASDLYGVPEFRYGKCCYAVQAEIEEQEKVIIAPRFQQRTFDTFKITSDNEEAYQAAVEYVSSFRGETTGGLMFVGPPGTGKTHLAAAVLREVFRKGVPCSFIQVPRLLEEIRNSYNNESEQNTENLARTATRKFVVLDDMGAERLTDWVREQMYMIVNDRYGNMLPTVITSNCTITELAKRLGERTADRLSEMCRVVPLMGKSWRRAG